MKAIDIHAHIFHRVHGSNSLGPVVSESFGRVENHGSIKPFMPPLSDQTSFEAENLLELMRRSEVEKAVLVQNPTIGSVNEEIVEAVRNYPGIFTGAIQVDPFSDHAPDQVRQWADTGAFTSLKLEMSHDWGWIARYSDRDFHYSDLYPLLDVAQERKLIVILDTGATTGSSYRPEEIRLMAEKYSDVNFILEHQGYWTFGGNLMKYAGMIQLGKKENVYFGISAAGHLLEEEYPCKGALTFMREMYELIGADKMMWGSDCPITLNRYTYQQMKDVVAEHTPFFPEKEREKVLYGNADAMFFK